MKKSCFSRRLYLEGLRQLRLPGIIGGLLLVLAALLVIIGRAVTHSYLSSIYLFNSIDLFSAFPLLPAVPLLLAPLMILRLFRFLNKRSSSDFYHGLPENRLSLFLSFFAAAMTWLTGILLLVSTITLSGFSIVYHSYAIQWAESLSFLFNMFAATVYVSAAFSLCMCITGTVLTNVTASLLLIFLPRLLLSILSWQVTELLPLLPEGLSFPLSGSEYQIVFGLFASLGGMQDHSPLTYLPGGLYTLILGLLYGVGAAALFLRRKSEAAGLATPNRALQTTLRLLVAFLLCQYPCRVIIRVVLHRETVTSSAVFTCVVWYIVALVVYFLFELVTTRRVKNLLRSLPAVGLLALLNLLFIGGMACSYHTVISANPTPEEIETVVFDTDDSLGDRFGRHFIRSMQGLTFQGEEVRQQVSERLRDTASVFRGDWNNDHNVDKWMALRYDNSMSGSYCSVKVDIRLEGRILRRKIALSPEDIAKMKTAISREEAFRAAYAALPSPENCTIIRGGRIIDTKARQVYETMRREIPTVDFETWYAFMDWCDRTEIQSALSGTPSDIDCPFPVLPDKLTIKQITEESNLSFPLPAFLTDTADVYMSYYADDWILDALTASPEESRYTVQFTLYPSGETSDVMTRIYQHAPHSLAIAVQRMDSLTNFLKENRLEQPDMKKPTLCIAVKSYTGPSTNRGNLYFCSAEDGETLNRLVEQLF